MANPQIDLTPVKELISSSTDGGAPARKGKYISTRDAPGEITFIVPSYQLLIRGPTGCMV
jgi:hypothetical protein